MNKYEVFGVVGEGAYGVVLKCRNKQSGGVVAIKKFKESEDDEAVRRTALREVRILRMVQHRNIVALREAFRRKGKLYLVFEYVEKNLLEVLEGSPNGLPGATIRSFVHQLCSALEYCHAADIVHRDVKPENLLISATGELKLCDFGFARTLGSSGGGSGGGGGGGGGGRGGSVLTDYVATRWYRSPELLLGAEDYGRPVDIWAAGCIMGELLDGEPLFPGESDIDQLYVIQRVLGPLTRAQNELFLKNPRFVGLKFPDMTRPESLERRYFKKMSRSALSFLAGCLSMDPNDRLTASDCVAHTYFDSLREKNKLRGSGRGSDPSMAAGASAADPASGGSSQGGDSYEHTSSSVATVEGAGEASAEVLANGAGPRSEFLYSRQELDDRNRKRRAAEAAAEAAAGGHGKPPGVGADLRSTMAGGDSAASSPAASHELLADDAAVMRRHRSKSDVEAGGRHRPAETEPIDSSTMPKAVLLPTGVAGAEAVPVNPVAASPGPAADAGSGLEHEASKRSRGGGGLAVRKDKKKKKGGKGRSGSESSEERSRPHNHAGAGGGAAKGTKVRVRGDPHAAPAHPPKQRGQATPVPRRSPSRLPRDPLDRSSPLPPRDMLTSRDERRADSRASVSRGDGRASPGFYSFGDRDRGPVITRLSVSRSKGSYVGFRGSKHTNGDRGGRDAYASSQVLGSRLKAPSRRTPKTNLYYDWGHGSTGGGGTGGGGGSGGTKSLNAARPDPLPTPLYGGAAHNKASTMSLPSGTGGGGSGGTGDAGGVLRSRHEERGNPLGRRNPNPTPVSSHFGARSPPPPVGRKGSKLPRAITVSPTPGNLVDDSAMRHSLVSQGGKYKKWPAPRTASRLQYADATGPSGGGGSYTHKYLGNSGSSGGSRGHIPGDRSDALPRLKGTVTPTRAAFRGGR